jgi:hypothetical protein
MKRTRLPPIPCLLAALVLLLAAPAQAAALFFDNFDNSFWGEPGLVGSVWPKWPIATDHMNASLNHNHTPGGTTSIRLDPAFHQTLANYHDFGAAAVAVTATAWVFEDNNQVGSSTYPINYSIGLFGDSASPTDNTDYLLLGLNPGYADYNTYGYKSLSGGIGNTSVTRAAALAGSADASRWIKLTIQADSLAAGGHVGFYINDVLVGSTYRTPGISLRYFFMGTPGIPLQTANYEFFWFDDISIVAIPEITGITVSDGWITIDFISAVSEQASDFTLVSSSTVNGVYSPAAGASITGSGGSYQATVLTSDPAQFYRIQR